MNIRHIIVSDLHLGSANSILTRLSPDNKTSLPNQPGELLKQLVQCMRHVVSHNEDGRPATLVLNGDFLELALAEASEAAMTFRRFSELLMAPSGGKPSPIAREIFCIPGNHDHHLWNTARETQYVENYLSTTTPDTLLVPEYQVTNMFHDDRLNPVPAYFLNAVVAKFEDALRPSFLTVYPNFGLLNADKSRCVVLHHGHYIESIYTLMSRIKKNIFPQENDPVHIWDLEAENGAWIDFFWSTLGRSGTVGKGMGLVYDKMQDEKAFDELLHNLAHGIIALNSHWAITHVVETWMIEKILKATLGKFAMREVHESEMFLSDEARSGMEHYLKHYVLEEIKRGNGGAVPPETTFIFGHTHKPFEDQAAIEGYARPVKLLNSGGWVVDTLTGNELHGGAMILVDDRLNTASVHLYHEAGSPDEGRIEVRSADDNPFFKELQQFIQADQEPWKTFSQLASQAVQDHRDNLKYQVSTPV